MNEKTLSAIRHILTVLASIIGFVGLGKFLPIIQFLQENLSGVAGAITGLISFILGLIAFFQPNKNLESRFTVSQNQIKATKTR